MIYHFNEHAIHYTIKGTGKPLVLLHGFLESSTMWHSMLKHFSGFKVIAIDLPGHGKSDAIAKSHTMELQAAVVHAILKKENIQKARFIGHSMGGYILLAFAELYPESVSKLILLNSTPKDDSSERKKNRTRLLKIIRNSKNAFVSMAISNLFTATTRIKFEKEIQQLKNEALTFPIEGIEANIRGMRDRKDRTSVLEQFQKDKYIISGTEDPIIAHNDILEIAEKTNTTLLEVASGHFSILENYIKMAQLLPKIVS